MVKTEFLFQPRNRQENKVDILEAVLTCRLLETANI